MTPATRQTMTARQRPPNGTLATTSVYAPGTAVGERLAYAYGDLATGTVMYACHDQLGSVRRWRTPSKGNWGANEFEPYGEAYAVSSLAPRDYALHEWDPALAVYRAPYRNYSPTMTRWTTRDPLGMINGSLEKFGDTFKTYIGGLYPGIVTTNPALIQHVLQKNNRNYCKSPMHFDKLAHPGYAN